MDNLAAGNGDGSMVAPFDRLSRAAHAADVGDTIYVFRGDGSDRGLEDGIRLRPYQRLIGAGAPFTTAEGEALAAGEAPVISGGNEPAVVLADHSTVEGLTLVGAGAAVLVGEGAADVRLATLRVEGRGAGASGVWLDGVQRATLEEVSVAGVLHQGILATESSAVTLRACHLESTGNADGDAAFVARELRGEWAIIGTDLTAAGGAALRIDATRGEASLALQAVNVAAGASPQPVRGVDLRLAGDAALTVTGSHLVIAHPRGDGVTASAGERARLRLELTGGGYADPRQPSATALEIDARGSADVSLMVRGNDLLASDMGTMLSASGGGRIHGVLDGNNVGGGSPARGIVMLLGDHSEIAVTLAGNKIVGQRAEAIYGVVATQARLGLDAHDNQVEASTTLTTAPLPSVSIETRDAGAACVALRGNRFGDGSGGGPSLALRQVGDSSLALAGFDTAAAESAGQRLATANRLGRIEIEARPGHPLASAGALQCPAPPSLPASAVAQQ